MKRFRQRGAIAVAGVALAAVAAGASGGVLTGTPPTASPHSSGGPQSVTAVVALSGSGPVAAPGVTVRYWPAVGAELVRGAPADVRRVLADPRVAGASPDRRLSVTDSDQPEHKPGVFASRGLGAPAGRRGAGAGVTVALVDTGVSDTPALDRSSGRLVDGVDTSQIAAGGDAVTIGSFTDGFGHGTFLASVIAGGVAPGVNKAVGVAPGARIVVVKVADDTGVTSLSDVLAGLDWVATHQPIDVVNLALAVDRPGVAYGADPLTMAMRHLRAAGLTVVVSAGNSPGEVADPGFEPKVLTVGAADTSGGRPTVAAFSGSDVVDGVGKPDVVAPGVHVLGELPPDSVLAQLHRDAQRPNGLWVGSGTSQATAVTSGLAAIWLAAHPGDGPLQVKAAIRSNTTALDSAAAGQGLVSTPRVRGDGNTGEDGFDEDAYWAAKWDVPGWMPDLGAMWSTGSWTATQWSANPWAGDGWSAASWAVKSWSVKSWSVKSWSTKSWSVKSWSAQSWGDSP